MRSRNEYAWKVGFGLFGMTDGELGRERRSAIFIDVRNVDLSLALLRTNATHDGHGVEAKR